MQQKASSAGTENETRNNRTRPPVLDANSSTRIGPSSNPVVNMHHETEVMAITQRLAVPVPEYQGDNFCETDLYTFSGGDFLELLDLDNPASPATSESSSAVSISSDECFDSMALLQDLNDSILEQNDAGRRLNVSATNKSDEVVIVPATLGTPVSAGGSNSGSDEFFATAGLVPGSASESRNLNEVTEHAEENQRGKGPSSSPSDKPSASSESHAAAGGRKSAAFGGMKELLKEYMPY